MTESRLRFFPPSLFAAVMGTAGLAIALKRGAFVLGLPTWLGLAFAWLAAAIFVAVGALYLAKALRFPGEVGKDLHHPVKLNFIPAISICLLLLSIYTLHGAPLLSLVLWSTGAVLHLALTVYVVSYWIDRQTVELGHVNPAWFIPAVGNVLVPIAGVAHAPIEISYFYFGIGFLFWLVLLPLVMKRLFLLPALPPRLQPMLAILIAPPAVGFVSYVGLTQRLDGFALALYGVAAFFVLLLAARASRLARLPFALSWWAYSFPLAAFCIATLVMAERTGSVFLANLAATLLALVTLLVLGLLARTGLAAARGQICVDEEAGAKPATPATQPAAAV